MGYDPPGLEQRPDDGALFGFGSLAGDTNSPPPGLVKTVMMLPVQLLKVLIRVPVAIVKAPFRLLGKIFGRSKD